MQTVFLGSTGVQVSRLCFGTMTWGKEADEATSAQLYARCREAGINFFDCANVYNGGKSEEILGRLATHERDSLVLTSKVFGAMGKDPNARGLSRRHITRAVEDSLRRLQTDRLDLYFLHQSDPSTPIEETLRALDDLVQAGKIVYPAISNHAAWQIMRALGKSELHGWAKFVCVQPMYSLVKRQAEVEILPLCESENLGVISYSPLGGGLLSGKYNSGQSGRLTENELYTRRYQDAENFKIAERFSAHARKQGIHPATLAVSWVMQHPAVTAPIIGARNLEQLEPSLAAANYAMSNDEYALISSFSPAPPPATDRSETQAQAPAAKTSA